MEIKIIKNQENWDGFIKSVQQYTSFSQSWEWGEVLIEEGKKVERLAVMEGEKTLAQAQVVYNNLPLGMKYAFCPKGPLFRSKTSDLGPKILEILLGYLKECGCVFVRTEPKESLYLTSYILRLTPDVNPSVTLILDLSKFEDELLKNMHSKTRYNIRLAEKKDLRIENQKDYENFIKLMKQTGKRDGFRLHEDKHYKKILESSSSLQLTAYSAGKAIAVAVFIGFGDTFTYLYGASDYEFRNLMAPYLLQWEGIKLGKSLGYRFYDFFGVAPAINPPLSKERKEEGFAYDKNHQYAGVTRFKLGFAGEYQKDPGTFDLVINKPKYFLYKFLRKMRRMF